MGCPSVPPVIVDTTDADALIIDVADTAGTIEVQTITVYETVTKLIYNASPEEKAMVESQFAAIRKSVAHLRGLPAQLIEAFGAKARSDGAEIARLRPFEPKAEKMEGQRNTLFFVCVSLVLVIGCGIILKLKGW